MSRRCLNCFRPAEYCLCKDIVPVDPGVKFVILMHPWEAKRQKTGTGRLTALCLDNAEIIIGKSFDKNNRYRELLESDAFYPVILYPGTDSLTAAQFADSPSYITSGDGKTLLVFLVDATWVMARKMVHHTPSLQTLPRLSFQKPYRSRYEFKTQPDAHCLSTIESTCFQIREMQDAGLINPEVRTSGMMDVFQRLIDFQLDCEKRGSAP
ncbi:MAG: DTW domain-containing protein [Spirochaetales bacterium]|nr:DTW domain-containing protein [Spirochaetales bacterium]